MLYDKVKKAIRVSMGCLGAVVAAGLVLGAAGGALYAVVKIIRVAWGP